MSEPIKNPLKLFYCYAHEDQALRDALDSHLISLKRQKLIEIWYDGKISAGVEWEKEINRHLSSADIVLLLVSVSFLASDYCYSREMTRALQRHAEGTARVIPVILRPVDWEDAPFSNLQVLPAEAKPVTRWLSPDDAYEDIAKKLRVVVKELQAARETAGKDIAASFSAPRMPPSPQRTKEEWVNEGIALRKLEKNEEALLAYEEAIRLDPNYTIAYYNKGLALYYLKRYEEALVAYEEAIRLDPNYVNAYFNMGLALDGLEWYEEALVAYEEAIRLDPNDADTYYNKGLALYSLKQYGKALIAYDQSIRLDPNNRSTNINKGHALYNLKRHEEALLAYEEASRLDPNYANAYLGRGNALHELKRYKDALLAYEEAIRLNPNYALAYSNKALTLDSLGRLVEAQQARKKASELGYT